MPAGETRAHLRLKELALAWAAAQGWPWSATEVRVPRSGYRADVVACAADDAGPVVVFECKQSRADLLKDAHAEAAVRTQLAELETRQRALDDLLAVHQPERRRGEALWPEFDTWDFTGLEHRTRERVVAELATARRRVVDGTKFSRMRRWRCADRLYLVLEENLHAEAELPAGWGVLLRRGDELAVLRDAELLGPAPAQRAAWRRAFAAKCAGPHAPEPGLLFAESA